jgi:hypothetical protein
MEKFMEIRAIAQELNTVDPTTFPAQEPEEKAMKEAFSMVGLRRNLYFRKREWMGL